MKITTSFQLIVSKGVCQDLYMGIVNLAINDHFPLLKYPITIAGDNGLHGTCFQSGHGSGAGESRRWSQKTIRQCGRIYWDAFGVAYPFI